MKKRTFLIILSLLFALYFSGLSSFGLTEPDEPRYAEAAREMLEFKSLFTPYYNYEPRWEKPPLFYLLVASSYKAFGVSEGSARLPSVVMAFLTAFFMLLVFFKAGQIERGMKAFVLFLTMPYVFVISHLSITDMTLCFFITLSSYSFFLFLEGYGRAWRSIAYISMAFGILTKGPVAFLIPIPSAILYLFFSKRYREIPSLFSGMDIAIFLLISVPWFVYLYVKVGPRFFYAQTIGRYFKGIQHRKPFYFFIPYIVGGALPQLFLIQWKEPLPKENLLKFSLSCSLFIFFFFSVSKCKLPNYILPIFPPLAILISYMLGSRTVEPVVGACLVFYFAVKLFMVPTYGSRLSIRPLFEGKSFENNATFLYFKKPYKAYPFYVRKKVFRVDRTSEILLYSGTVYLLIKKDYIPPLEEKKYKVVSRSVFRRKELFLLRFDL